MDDPPKVNNAIDTVGCLYLAKEAERCGDEEAAEWTARPDDYDCCPDDASGSRPAQSS
jgi:hypothetical protein